MEVWKVSHFDFERMWQDFTYQEIECAYVQYLEAKERLCRMCGVRGTLLFIDISEVPLSWAVRQLGAFTKFAKMMAYYGEQFYPDVMEKGVLIHAPFFVGMGWSVVSALLSQHTRDLIAICAGEKIPKEVQESIDKADLNDLRQIFPKFKP